jgi:hypothetical protein
MPCAAAEYAPSDTCRKVVLSLYGLMMRSRDVDLEFMPTSPQLRHGLVGNIIICQLSQSSSTG